MSTTKPDYRRYNDCAPPLSLDGWTECRADLRQSVPIRQEESLSESVERLHWEKHAAYRRWQDAVEMNMVFGDDYVTAPPIPKGYEKLAQQWRDNLKPVR